MHYQRIPLTTFAIVVLFLAFSATCYSQTAPTNEREPGPLPDPPVSVESIEFVSTAGGGNADISFEFFPVGSSGAHLSLATGALTETIGQFDPATTDGLWWDVDLKVTASPNDIDPSTGRPRGPVMIAIDKDVFNLTQYHWTDFHMTIGMRGPNGQFMESDEFDFLFFKDLPEPIEKRGKFANPPMKDEPVAPDNLWWFEDAANPGVDPGDWAQFWLGIQIPPSKFNDMGMAQIVLREHASIPEPAGLALAAIAVAMATARRR
ncbi:MAG: hypothetical protein AAGD11_12375 [Planctomycetota bacterium]